MHSFCLTCSQALYHITLPPRGQSMNLHSERYEQRRRTWSKVHNDCSESVFVMWFVTPSVLSLMWLRDGLWPAVSDEMVVSDRRSKAETRKCLACLQSVTGPRKTGSEKMTTAKTSRYILGGGACTSVSVCLNELNIDDSIFCTPISLSFFFSHTYHLMLSLLPCGVFFLIGTFIVFLYLPF